MPFRALLGLLLVCSCNAFGDTIAIIGTGDVGAALGPEFAAQGNTVVYGSRDPSREKVVALVSRTGANASATTPAAAVVGADIVVLAVPGLLVEEITRGLGDLSGKIIIEPTNPLQRSETAKARVAKLVEGMGLGAIDVGPVEHAHWVEGMLILWINNRYASERPGFDYHLRKN